MLTNQTKKGLQLQKVWNPTTKKHFIYDFFPSFFLFSFSFSFSLLFLSSNTRKKIFFSFFLVLKLISVWRTFINFNWNGLAHFSRIPNWPTGRKFGQICSNTWSKHTRSKRLWYWYIPSGMYYLKKEKKKKKKNAQKQNQIYKKKKK